MPKPVDDLVKTLLEDPKFYPEKAEKEQKAIAYAIAWSNYKKNKKKKKRKKKSLSKLNKVIVALENVGLLKEAANLHNVFLRVASKLQ